MKNQIKVDLVALARQAHGAGRLDEAVAHYQQILSQMPAQLDALNGLAAIRANEKKPDEAINLWQRAIQAAPTIHQFHENLAKYLVSLKRYREALQHYREAQKLNASHYDYWLAMATIAEQIENRKDAETYYRNYLAAQPKDIKAQLSLANNLVEQEKFTEAEVVLQQAGLRAPDHIGVVNNWGLLRRAQERLTEAQELFEQVVSRQPDYAPAWNNLGVVHQDSGRYPEAMAAFFKAVAINPADALTAYNMANCKLLYEKFPEAWAAYPAMHHYKDTRQLPQPYWEGQDLAGKTLLMWNYQGIGEDILQASLCDELEARGAKLIIESQPKLIPLLQRRHPNAEFLVRPPRDGVENPRVREGTIDFQVPSFWACRFLRQTFQDFPKTYQPFLKPDAALVQHYREKYQAMGAKRIVGISWRSKGLFHHMRSLNLEDWQPLLELPDTLFVDLQYGNANAERAHVAQKFAHIRIHYDGIDPFHDLEHHAAQIAACDDIVSIRNTAVHVAGAMGKPCHVLMPPPQAATWFWFRYRDTSPWYPTLKLYQLNDSFNWQDVLKNL